MKVIIILFCITSFLTSDILLNNSLAQEIIYTKKFLRQRKPFIIWEGTNPIMKASDLAAYCAPVFWFSADEPELRGKSGKKIKIPSNFPFESRSDSPVVYYQLTYILTKDKTSGPAFKKDYFDIGNSVIDFRQVRAFDIYYNHYYKFEAGLGSHEHDTEQAQFQFYVRSYPDSNKVLHYIVYFIRVTAKAHALEWYDNIYEIDTKKPDIGLSLPFKVLVEEGKHASCSDMNGDGYYTPGYDVNVRKNDAWGVRDVIRGGELFSSDFQSFMAKVRRPEYMVMPPLPEDSPLREKYTVDSLYSPHNAVYQLRPMPSYEKALNKILKHDMESYYMKFTPDVSKESSQNDLLDWFADENFINSFGISYRIDDDVGGLSVCFPLLIVKNVEAPILGGWLVNRVYLESKDLGYNILFTPSASRFLDPYLSAGVEVYNLFKGNDTDLVTTSDFVFETGIKLRGNVSYSPLKFLRFLSPFWGVRLGIKNIGFMDIKNLNYVIEIGAGVW